MIISLLGNSRTILTVKHILRERTRNIIIRTPFRYYTRITRRDLTHIEELTIRRVRYEDHCRYNFDTTPFFAREYDR